MLLNEFISEYKKSDELNALGKRYFSHSRYLRNPAGSEDMRRFKDAVNYFKKYAHQYEMDYLLIAAQAYQESRIDQSKRSSRGAVGVMQILPNTADKPPISLPGIERIETNIHAGVKYHRFIIDKYFNSPDITPLNRMLFAFAAYNAGPGNLAKMRKLTKKIGLDPNTWFSNVEIAAGKVTGFETVHYVGNIYKYYVAYRLIMDGIAEKERLKDERSY
jgi:membrane-bound lytic murein transglycosylase MltF